MSDAKHHRRRRSRSFVAAVVPGSPREAQVLDVISFLGDLQRESGVRWVVPKKSGVRRSGRVDLYGYEKQP